MNFMIKAGEIAKNTQENKDYLFIVKHCHEISNLEEFILNLRQIPALQLYSLTNEPHLDFHVDQDMDKIKTFWNWKRERSVLICRYVFFSLSLRRKDTRNTDYQIRLQNKKRWFLRCELVPRTLTISLQYQSIPTMLAWA